MSKAKTLSKKLGGNWKYQHPCSWFCDDDIRHVSRVCMCEHDDYCDCLPGYFLYYRNGRKHTERIYFLN